MSSEGGIKVPFKTAFFEYVNISDGAVCVIPRERYPGWYPLGAYKY